MSFVSAPTLPEQQPMLQVAQEDTVMLDHRLDQMEQWLQRLHVLVGQFVAEPRVYDVQVLFVRALGHQNLLGQEVGGLSRPFLHTLKPKCQQYPSRNSV